MVSGAASRHRYGWQSKLTVRRASPEELSRFLEAKAATIEAGDELLLVYLVELDHVI